MPTRSRDLSSSTMLISIFSEYPTLVPFIKHLFTEYGIVTVADWDMNGGRLLDSYPLGPSSKMLFLKKLGRPAKNVQKQGAIILPFVPLRLAAHTA
jgi:hypothetical protein